MALHNGGMTMGLLGKETSTWILPVLLLSILVTQCSPDALQQPSGKVLANRTVNAGVPVDETETSKSEATGEVFYQKYCASCHGPLASSTKLGISVDDLTSALNRPPMDTIKLTEFQIKAIVEALNSKIDRDKFKDGEVNSGLANFDKGVELYAAKCQVCHGAIEVSTKRNTTTTKLSSAMMSVPSMLAVNATALEKELIIFALNHSRSEFTEVEEEIQYLEVLSLVSPLKNRNMLSEKLTYLFATNGAGAVNSTISNIIIKYITKKPVEVGGLCFQGLDPACPGPASFNSSTIPFETAVAKMEPTSDAVRAALLSDVCIELTLNSTAVSNVLAKAGLTTTSNFTNANIKALWTTLFPEVGAVSTATAAEESATTAVTTLAAASTAAKAEVWADIIAAACQSPMMEAY